MSKHNFKTLFLRCSDEEQLKECIEQVNSYSTRYLGKISRPTGETIIEDDVEVLVMGELPDFHANLLVCTCCMQDTLDAVADVTIECPNSPSEVFA